MTKYDYVINLFTSDRSSKSGVFKKIHAENGFAYATNSFYAIRIAEVLLGGKYEKVEGYPEAAKIDALISPDGANWEKKELNTEQIFSLLAKFKFQYEKEECEECDGEGTSLCHCCGQDAKCEKCNGTGRSKEEVPFAKFKCGAFEHLELFGASIGASFLNTVAIAASIIGGEWEVFVKKDKMQITLKNKDVVITIMCLRQTPSVV